MHHEECEIEADEDHPERGPGKVLDGLAPADMRYPVIKPGEHGKEKSPDQDIMKMRHHKMCIMCLLIEGYHGQHDAGQAADDEHAEKPEDVEHGNTHRRLAACDGSKPGEYLDRCRDGDKRARGRKNDSATWGMPTVYMWCTHSPKDRKAMAINAATMML